jgi:hypothetical protein
MRRRTALGRQDTRLGYWRSKAASRRAEAPEPERVLEPELAPVLEPERVLELELAPVLEPVPVLEPEQVQVLEPVLG